MGGGTSLPSFSDEIKNVTDIKGLATNSASPTDTWIVTYQQKNGKLEKLFWKMFVTSDYLSNSDSIASLKYEIFVYRDIVKPLIKNNVCPFFVRYIHHFENVTYKELVDLTNDEINLSINKKYLICQSLQKRDERVMFKSDYVDTTRICDKRDTVKMMKNVADIDYQIWMTLHQFSFADKFDCFKVKETKGKKPLFDDKYEMTLPLIETLKTLSPIELNRFFRESTKLFLKKYDRKSAIDKIVRRKTDNNYLLDDVLLSQMEKESFSKDIQTNNIISKDDLSWFQRNLSISLQEPLQDNEQEKRQEKTSKFLEYLHEKDESVKYTILITEATKPNTTTFFEFINTMVTNVDFYKEHFLSIYLQICIACYSLSLTKTNHNDLHSANVFVCKLPVRETFIFRINISNDPTKPIFKDYTFTSYYKVTLYDFDRAYATLLGKNKYLDDVCGYGQCNNFIEKLDIFKVSCYFAEIPLLADIIFPLICTNAFTRQKLLYLYEEFPDKTKKCAFSQQGLHEKLSDWMLTYPKMIDSIHSKITTGIDIFAEKHISYINKFFFDDNGKLDIENQKREVQRLQNDIESEMDRLNKERALTADRMEVEELDGKKKRKKSVGKKKNQKSVDGKNKKSVDKGKKKIKKKNLTSPKIKK
jgi:hypothetical protein